MSIIIFALVAILAFAGGTWDTFAHLFGLACVGLAAFAASFLPIS